jgi:fused signal recognition particle receptor
MLILLIVLIAVALIVLAGTGFIIARRRGLQAPPAPSEGAEIPPRPPGAVEAPPRATTAQVEAPPEESEVAPPSAEPGVAVAPEAPAEAEAPAPVETPVPAEVPVPVEAPTEAPPEVEPAAPPRFRDRLSRARSTLGGYLTSVRSRNRIDDSTWEELEEGLILADVGATVTAGILDDLRARVKRDSIDDPDALVDALKDELKALLQGDTELHTNPGVTNVWLFVGVNGVGKTTTIGKLGRREVLAGHKVVMAAGDTFRAAAADQLEAWAGRVGASIIRGNEGGDPGAVVFDAVQHAAARNADLVLADTAGRLHTKTNLMEELKKVRRVAERPPGEVTEVLLVIDATTGQNGLIQAQQFAAAVGVTGVVLTKLDGTAKGGIVVAIRRDLDLPIKLVGLGEGAGDLVEFDAEEFVEALVGTD